MAIFPSLELLSHEICEEETFLVNYIEKHLPDGNYLVFLVESNQTEE